MELTHAQTEEIMKRFPSFELSYETISHKKVSPAYNSCFAIPQGRKCYAWFTYLGDKDVCFILELNREKKINKAIRYEVDFDMKLAYGTVVYGTLVDDENEKSRFFAAEDIFYFKGICLKQCKLAEKLDLMIEVIKSSTSSFTATNKIVFSLPVFWDFHKTEDFELTPNIPDSVNETIPYTIHHLQYRSLYETNPYMNVYLNRKLNLNTPMMSKETKKEKNPCYEMPEFTWDTMKPQYRYPTVFQVTADLQFDIYHLHAYGLNNKPTYYGVAYVPTYKSSVFMNGLFRNIAENKNLDYIEESEDEEDFQNVSEDKYVDLEKTLLMECTFHPKFKKWIPQRVVDKSNKMVHVTRLARDTSLQQTSNYRPKERQQYQSRPRPNYRPNGKH